MISFSPIFKLSQLKEKVNEGHFDDEVYDYLMGVLSDYSLCYEDGLKLLNGEIKPYDFFELSIEGEKGKYYYITSNSYLEIETELYKLLKDRIYIIYDKVKTDFIIDVININRSKL